MEQENLGRRSGKTTYKGKMFEPPSDLHVARQRVGCGVVLGRRFERTFQDAQPLRQDKAWCVPGVERRGTAEVEKIKCGMDEPG